MLVSGSVLAQNNQSADDMYAFMAARMAARQGETAKAMEMMKGLVERHPENPVLRFEMAQIYLETARVEKAVAELREAARLDPAFYDARRLLGRLLIDTSGGVRTKVDEALVELDAAYRQRPSDIGTGLAIVQIHLGAGRLDAAETVLKELADFTPDNRTVNFQLSQLLTRNGKPEESKVYLERVVAEEPTFAPAVFQLVDMYQADREWARAAAVLEPLAQADIANLDLQRRLGFFYLRAGRADDAVRLFENLIKVEPGDERTLYMLAESLSAAGDYEKANVLYRRLLQKRPTDPELLISLGANQLAQSNFEDAKSTFRQLAALTDVPEQVLMIARTQLAAIDHRQKRYDEALDEATTIVETAAEPNYQATSIALDIHRRRATLDEAIAMIDEAIERFPDDEIFKIRKLEFLVRAGRDADAARMRDELVAKGERGALAAVQAYVQAEVYEPAIPILLTLREQKPDDIGVLFQLGASYERTGQHEKSEEAFLELLSKNPSHASSLNYLGYMWADRGVNLERAETMILEAVRQEPRNGAFVDSLGWVYYKLGKLDLAKKHMIDAAFLVPDDPTVRMHLGDVYLALGLEKEALAEYRVALANEPNADDEVSIRERIGNLEKKLGRR
jgi:tetratricopeptide (TPR) repeat protein